MIKKALELGYEKIYDFIEKTIDNFDEWDGVYYTLRYLLGKEDYSNLFVIVDKNEKICDLINSFFTYGVLTICPYFIKERDNYESLFCEIKEFFVDQKFILYTNGIDVSKYGFIWCNTHSSLTLEHTYSIEKGTYSVIDKNDVNILRDAIEDIYFPALDFKKDNISFELIHGEDINYFLLNKETHDYPIWINRTNHHNIIGFHYLQPDFCECHSLLVAKCNETIVGCIKYGKYDVKNSSCHYGLNYIDVNLKYRGNGIAKLLINEFAKILENDMPLFLSDESDMGKICNMAKHFKNANFKTKVYTYQERLY